MDIESERAKFEAWMPSNYYVGFDYDNTTFQRKRDGCYICDYVEEAWSIWLARARKAAEDAEKWLPIESAKKDRSSRLVYVPCVKCSFLVNWNEIDEEWEFFGGSGKLKLEISHWRPLPPPPAAQEGDAHD